MNFLEGRRIKAFGPKQLDPGLVYCVLGEKQNKHKIPEHNTSIIV